MYFTVNGQTWKLSFVPANSQDLQRSDGTYTFGVTDNNTKTVSIASGMSAYMTERVICHELTHVMCFAHDVSIPIDLEERLCNFMADYGKEIIYLLDDLLSKLRTNAI